MRFKAALIVLLAAVCSTEAVACVNPNHINKCNTAAPAVPMTSIPLDTLHDFRTLVALAGVAILALAIGSIIKSPNRFAPIVLGAVSLFLAPLLFSAYSMSEPVLSTVSCGCAPRRAHVPITGFLQSEKYFQYLVWTCIVLLGALLIRTIKFRRALRPHLG